MALKKFEEAVRDADAYQEKPQSIDASINDFCQSLVIGPPHQEFSFEGRNYLSEIINDPSPKVIIRKGRQVGMSVMAAALILYNALRYPGTTHIYASDTFEKLHRFSIDYLLFIMEHSGIDVTRDKRILSYRLANGSKIFLIGHHDGWKQGRGAPADFVYLDEIQEQNLEKLPNILENMAMSDYRRCWILGTGSYEGCSWQKYYNKTDQKVWENGKWVKTADSDLSGYHVPQYLMPNWTAQLEAEKRRDYFANEYIMEVEGGFATGLSVPLPYSTAMTCFIDKPFQAPNEIIRTGKIIASLDLAAGGDADTVLTISRYEDNKVHVLFAENYQDQRAQVLFDKIDNRLKEYTPDKIASDAGGNNELLYLLQQAYEVTSFRHTASKDNMTYKDGKSEISINKSFFTQKTISRFTENLISIPTPDPNWLIDQLTAETAETVHNPTGASYIRFGKLPNRKDDFLQSLIFLEAMIHADEDEDNPHNFQYSVSFVPR